MFFGNGTNSFSKQFAIKLLIICIILEMCFYFFGQKVMKNGVLPDFSDRESLSLNEKKVDADLAVDNGYSVGVYYSNWSPYQPRLHFPHDIDLSKVSHVYYSFFLVDSKTGIVKSSDEWSDFEMDLYKPLSLQMQKNGTSNKTVSEIKSVKKKLPMGCVGELFYLKHSNLVYENKERNFKTIMTVGGWSNRDEFPLLVVDEGKLDKFIKSCVDNMMEYGFDGIDLDWEFPKNDGYEPGMYLKIMSRLKDEFSKIEEEIYGSENKTHPKFQLSIATPAFEEKLSYLPIDQMNNYIDIWNMMTYDYHGSWSESTGYHSNLYSKSTGFQAFYKHDPDDSDETALNGNSAIEYMTKHCKIPPNKLALGMAAYGRGFTKVKASPNEERYIGKKYKGVGGASEGEPGMWLYNQLPIKNSVEKFDSDYVSAFCFDSKTKTFVGYDNVESMQVKAEYVKKHKLAGGFWWESCGDDHKNKDKSLLNAFALNIENIAKNQRSIFQEKAALQYYLKRFKQDGFLSSFIKSILDKEQNN